MVQQMGHYSGQTMETQMVDESNRQKEHSEVTETVQKKAIRTKLDISLNGLLHVLESPPSL